MIRALIVDDEPLARRGIRLHLEAEPDVAVVGEAADGEAAVAAIRSLLPDLVFLDVQMPGMGGFETLAAVAGDHLPSVVFVTAHDHYALRAFEVAAVDYLLKPFTRARFGEAVARVRRQLTRPAGTEESAAVAARLGFLLDATESTPAPLRRLAVRLGDRHVLVSLADVDVLRAAANYVELEARGRRHTLRTTLGALERRLDPDRFARIHRSTIVNLERVASVRSDGHGDFEVELTDGRRLRMTRAYRDRLLNPTDR